MEQVVIFSRAGLVKYDLPNTEPLRHVASAKLQRQHMANDYVQMQVLATDTMTLEVGDYIEVHGCRYSIRAVTDVTRSGEEQFTYSITFYGVMYDLMRYKYRNTAINGRNSSDTFDLTYTLKEFIHVLINNVARGEEVSDGETPTWVFDDSTCPDTEPKTLSFDKENLLAVLQRITEEFDVEFRIEQGLVGGRWMKTLRVGEFGTVANSTPFAYGMGNGLYQLQEGKVDDSCIINRLWAEGGTENILSGYRGYSTRIQMPRRRLSTKSHTITVDGQDKTFPIGTWIGIEDEEKRYIDEAVLAALSNRPGGSSIDPYNPSGLIAKYGVIEDSVVFDDVIPTRTFEVKSITNTNGRVFTCDVDFNLQAKWLLNYADFKEWCLLKTNVVPTEEQYNASVTLYDNNSWQSDGQGTRLSFDDYRLERGTGITVDPFVLWRQRHHSAAAPPLPTLPAGYDQDVYEQFCIYKDVVNGNNSKYLIDGGQVAFIDGKLSGITFDIAGSTYNSITHRSTITIRQKEDETETVFPSDDEFGAFRMAVGDKFKLVSIYMPYNYYEEAEEELWFRAYEKFENVKYPSFVYRLSFDPLFMQENNTLFASILPGDYITITDDRFGLQSKKMRVTQVDCDLVSENNYSLTLESVHKLKTRYGSRYTLAEAEALRALEELRLDDPMYRRNNRISGATTLHRILDGDGYLRDVRVADLFIAERMIASNAVVASKILNGAVEREKIAINAIDADRLEDGAVSNTKLAGSISRDKFLPSALFNFERFSPQLTYSKDSRVFKITGGTYRNIFISNEAFNITAQNISKDYQNNALDASKPYFIYFDFRRTQKVVVADVELSVDDGYICIGEAGVETNGERVIDIIAPAPNQPMSATKIGCGYLRDGSGNIIIDILNREIAGAVRVGSSTLAAEITSARTIRRFFTGSETGNFNFKDANGNDTNLQDILGTLPTTAGGLRKILADAVAEIADAVAEIGDESTSGTLKWRTKQVEDNKANAGDVWQKSQCYINPNTGAIIIGENSATPTTLENTVSQSDFNTYKQQLVQTFKQIEKTFGCNNIIISNRSSLDSQTCSIDSTGLYYPGKVSGITIDASTRFADLQGLAKGT